MYTKTLFQNMHHVQWIIVSWLLLLLPSSAICDDALLKVYGGGLKLFDGDSISVRMESETVRIELHKKTYTVDATFEFFNYGKTAIAQVGFPKRGYGYAPGFRGVSDLINFRTWVDGGRVDVKEVPGEVELNHQKIDAKQMTEIRKGELVGPLEETRWLVKSVTFRGNAKTVTRVKYSVPYGGRDSDRGEYLYGTGKSWKGTIGKARFIVKASPSISLFSNVKFTENGYEHNMRSYGFKRLGEYEYEYSLIDIEPKENENIKFTVTSSWEPWDGPAYSEKVVERKQLELLSLWQLKISRNTIYAFHGKIFKDPHLDKYFKKYDWYKPRQNYNESDLNKTEKDNIAAIAAYENELKAALHK
jgi:hypothetical protein